jgi:hypothetical protein
VGRGEDVRGLGDDSEGLDADGGADWDVCVKRCDATGGLEGSGDCDRDEAELGGATEDRPPPAVGGTVPLRGRDRAAAITFSSAEIR